MERSLRVFGMPKRGKETRFEVRDGNDNGFDIRSYRTLDGKYCWKCTCGKCSDSSPCVHVLAAKQRFYEKLNAPVMRSESSIRPVRSLKMCVD